MATILPAQGPCRYLVAPSHKLRPTQNHASAPIWFALSPNRYPRERSRPPRGIQADPAVPVLLVPSLNQYSTERTTARG